MRTRALALGIAAPLLALAWTPPALAQLTNDQASCVLGLGKSVWKIEKQVAKQASNCLTDFAKGEVPSVEACVASDPDGKIAKMTDKATEGYGKFCTPPPAGKLDDPFPPFGATDDAIVIAEGTRAAPDLAHDLFGADLDGGALSTDRDGSSCQRGLWKAASICALIRLKNLSSCQKDALATATSKAELRDACLGAGTDGQPDPTGKIAKKCADVSAGIPGAVAKKCEGQDLSALVPGCANADTGECVQQKTACHVCLAASQAGDLDRDCDLFDDGLDNASCDRGPIDVVCDAPSGDSMITITPGATVTFQGHATHPTGIDSVTVNGTGVTVAPDGSFELPVTASYGVNFVDVVATNAVGEQRSVACTFIAADSYLGEGSFVSNGYNLALHQGAIDDGVRTGSTNSFGDALARMVNTVELRDVLHGNLLAANPLKPSTCDSETCLPFFGCTCLVSSAVSYDPTLSISGPNTASLTLVNGGLSSVARINTINVKLRVTGVISTIPYDTSGFVTYGFVQVSQTSDVTLDGSSRPNVAQRPATLSTTLGTISTDFPSLDAFILSNVVVPLANGPLRDLVRNTINTYVGTGFNNALDDLLSGIDLVSPASIDVPTVTGGTLSIDLADQSSSVNVTTARALFGMSSRFTATSTAHVLPSLGTALSAPGSPATSGTEAGVASTSVPVINQALHALWRGGLLQTSVDIGVDLSGNTVTASVDGLLPPVALPPVAGTPTKLRLGIGGVRVSFAFPGVFNTPTDYEIGADMSGDLSLGANGRPQVTSLVIDALHRTAPDAVLTPIQLDLLDQAAPIVLQQLVATALDDAMTVALARTTGSIARTPEFPISPALAITFALPSQSFGLVGSPTFGVESSQLVYRGAFGLR